MGIGIHLEFHRIGLFVAKHFVELIHIHRFVGNCESASLIFIEHIEGCARGLASTINKESGASNYSNWTEECAKEVIDTSSFKPQRNIGLQHDSLINLASVLHQEILFLAASVLEAVVEVEIGQRAQVSSHIMEIRAFGEVNQVNGLRHRGPSVFK